MLTFINEKTIEKSHSMIISTIRVLVTSGGGEKEREWEVHLGRGTYGVSKVLFLNLAHGGYTGVCSVVF